MTTCRHQHLFLLPPEKNRLRCRRCHLTITPDELPADIRMEDLREAMRTLGVPFETGH